MMSRPLALLGALLLAGCSSDSEHQQAMGTLERDRLELTSESDERIVAIMVREGDHVEPGAELVRQEAGTMEPRLLQARAALSEAEHRQEELEHGPRARELDEARAALGGAESTLRTQQAEYVRVESLVQKHLVSASELDRARASRDRARAGRDEAAASLKLLQEGTRSEQIAQARATVERQRASLAELEISAARYSVRAPRAGRVEALPYKQGERPPAGAPVTILLADGVPYARVYVPEPLRAAFRPGVEVAVSVDGVTGSLRGTVRYVSAEATFTPYYSLTQKDRSRLSYLAEIDLVDPKAAELPVGIPVQVAAPPHTEPSS
jgi:HlyD family secretion protein